MKVVFLNPIIYTSETSKIKKKNSIKDTMGYNFCLEMKKHDIEPILIVAKDYQPIEVEDYEFDVVFLENTMRKIFKPNCFPYLKKLNKTLKELNPDYIISSEVFSMWSLSCALHYRKKTIIWHELAKHNNIMKKIPSKIWYGVICKLFFSKVRVVARSYNAKLFISNYCKNVSDTYIDHGVDLEKFKLEIEKSNQFVVISQLIDRKRIDGIIIEFSKFVRNNPDYNLYIIGDGERKEKLESFAYENSISDKVKFMGQLSHNNMIPFLSKSKALIINTEKDNSMLSIVESIACCTPILTTDIPYNCHYIKSNELGIVCTDSISESAMQLIHDRNKYFVDNCQNYRNNVSNGYHVEEFIREFQKLGEDYD